MKKSRLISQLAKYGPDTELYNVICAGSWAGEDQTTIYSTCISYEDAVAVVKEMCARYGTETDDYEYVDDFNGRGGSLIIEKIEDDDELLFSDAGA